MRVYGIERQGPEWTARTGLLWMPVDRVASLTAAYLRIQKAKETMPLQNYRVVPETVEFEI